RRGRDRYLGGHPPLSPPNAARLHYPCAATDRQADYGAPFWEVASRYLAARMRLPPRLLRDRLQRLALREGGPGKRIGGRRSAPLLQREHGCRGEQNAGTRRARDQRGK